MMRGAASARHWGALLWLALLSGTCSGYPGSSSWQVLAPGAVPAEHKMAKAFVVHLPIHTTQLEPVEEQRQPATVTAPQGGSDLHHWRLRDARTEPRFVEEALAPSQEKEEVLRNAHCHSERRARCRLVESRYKRPKQKTLKKLVILVRIPQEQPDARPPPPPPPPEVKRRPEQDKAAYDIQVDQKLPIILIALDKPLASHAKVQSVSAWKEPLHRPASSKEDRSSGNSKEWRPIIYPKRQRQHSTQQRQWSRWNKDLDRRTLWTKEQRQSSWKPAAPSSDVAPPAAPAKEQHNDGGSNEAKLLLLLVHENSPSTGDRGKTWEPVAVQQNVNEPTSSPWRPRNKPSHEHQQHITTDGMHKSTYNRSQGQRRAAHIAQPGPTRLKKNNSKAKVARHDRAVLQHQTQWREVPMPAPNATTALSFGRQPACQCSAMPTNTARLQGCCGGILLGSV
ncbi:hypothetical protein MTO96_010076 [Rhipicephalus appendiculatus]